MYGCECARASNASYQVMFSCTLVNHFGKELAWVLEVVSTQVHRARSQPLRGASRTFRLVPVGSKVSKTPIIKKQEHKIRLFCSRAVLRRGGDAMSTND